MKSLRRYWQETKERGVLAAIVVFAVVGFVVLLVSDLLGLLVALPAWLRPVILKTVLLGLPVTIIVSWLYNYRREVLPVGGRDLDAVFEDERARTASQLKSGVIIAGILVVTALLGAFMNLRQPDTDARNGRVAVAPFDNATTNDSLNDIGALMADEIATRLTQNRELQIVPYSSVVAYTADAGLRPGSDYEQAIQIARGVGAGYVVWGGYYQRHDTLLISGQVTDARTGDLVANIPEAGAPLASASGAVAGFRESAARVVRKLLRATGLRPTSFITLPIATAAAHRIYTDGLRHYAAADYDGAVQLFRQAEEEDTSFALAGIWLARSLAVAGRIAEADSVARALEPQRTRLNAYDRGQLDYVQAYSAYNLSLRYGASSFMVMISPASDDAQRLIALDALAWNHPREARSVLLSLDPQQGWLRSWPGYYSALATAYHLIGDYRDEERVVAQGLARYPGSLDLWLADCRARGALGQTPKEWWRIKAMLTLPQQRSSLTAGNALTRCSEELLAHEQPVYSHYAARLAADWFRTQGQQVPAMLRSDYSLALQLLGRPGEAYTEMKRTLQLPIAPADLPLLQARAAYFAAVAGRRQDAFVYDSTANAGSDRYPSPYVTMERARVSAALNDGETATTLMSDALGHGFPFAEPSATLLHADVTLRKLWNLPSFRALVQPGG